MKITSIIPLVAVLALGTLSLQAKDKKPKNSGTDYNAEEVVKKFDKNNDNRLSLEEFSSMKKFSKDKDPAAAAKKAFTEADANSDGFVTADELKAVHDKKVSKGDEAKKATVPSKTTATEAPKVTDTPK